MPVMIRSARHGAKKNSVYWIVATDKTQPRDGRYLEKLGQYYPKAKTAKEKLVINQEALKKWVDRGALVSETVGQLLKKSAK